MSEQIVRTETVNDVTIQDYFEFPVQEYWNEHGRRAVRNGQVIWADVHGTRATTPEDVDWSAVEAVPEYILHPVEMNITTVRFNGMLFGCSVQRIGGRWIAVGTQSRTYTHRGRNLGAFILERYSPNYKGTYSPTVGEYEWVGAGEKITPEMRQAIATKVANL